MAAAKESLTTTLVLPDFLILCRPKSQPNPINKEIESAKKAGAYLMNSKFDSKNEGIIFNDSMSGTNPNKTIRWMLRQQAVSVSNPRLPSY